MALSAKRWRFSASQLEKIRHEVNAGTRAEIARIRQEEGQSADFTALTVEEEALLCQFYFNKAVEVCQFINLPPSIQATAATYAKRFYLRYSCMDFHPKNIILAAIFLATKTEEHYMTMNDFLKRVSQKESMASLFLALEIVLLQALNFDLIVQHPFEPLYGFYLDILASECFGPREGAGKEFVMSVYSAARTLVAKSLVSDAMFLFQPSQIALSAFYTVASERHRESQMFAYLQLRFGSKPEELAAIKSTIEMIQHHVQSFSVVSTETARSVNDTLNGCKNPANDVDSAYYKRMKAREDEEREAKLRKATEAEKSAT